MPKGTACFYCRNSIKPRSEEDIEEWAYRCKYGIDNTEMNGHGTIPPYDSLSLVINCPKGSPRLGFQIGGYYTHMWFENDVDSSLPIEPGSHLKWCIASDGDFPTENDETGIEFHICDFEQIEQFVKFWKKEIKRRRLI